MKLKIAILGTRGIPNEYGGFEQFAENFAVRMAEKGNEVSVYCSSKHSYKASDYKGVSLIHCNDPEHIIGTAGQFVYDFNCIIDSRKRNFDIILQLGYTSSTVWSWLFPKRSLIVTNMDGLEWKRSKYNRLTRQFLKAAERWGAIHSNYLIADSGAIKQYLHHQYGVEASFVPYGAIPFFATEEEGKKLSRFNVVPYQYDLLIARFEPENNIALMLKSYSENQDKLILVIGNYQANAFGKKMYERFKSFSNIRFLGAIFDMDLLNMLRYYSGLYLHGHSVGGTNPSLLEAMACNALIAAHDNAFNRDVLGDEAFYFGDEQALNAILQQTINKQNYTPWLQANMKKIISQYNWETITDQLERLFIKWVTAG